MNSKTKPKIEYLAYEHLKGFPFSEAVRFGNVLYLSGQIGLDSSGKWKGSGLHFSHRC
jgi:enamine deaminase RidA (YjgF/YER057c/UK114 family)